MVAVLLDCPRCSLPDLVGALQVAQVLNGDADRLSFQIRQECFWTASAMAFLAAWGLLQKQHGARLSMIGDDTTRQYLARMDLFRMLEIPYEEHFERHSEVGRFIPIRLVNDTETCKQAVDAICDLVLHLFDNGRDFLPAMEWAVNEMVDNINLHAEAPTPGVVCAQYYPRRHLLDIAICDMGRGIKGSLNATYPGRVGSHGEAISKALERGVTRDPEVGMGNGLAGSREILQLNKGTFRLWTGDMIYRDSNGQDRFQEIPSIPGTGVVLSMDTRKPVDLSNTFIQNAADWSYLDVEARRLSHGTSVLVKEECHTTGQREPAKRLRRKILAVLPEMENVLIVDFTGVKRASSSFLDELLGRLVVELGTEEFRGRIRVENLEKDLLEMTNVVIKQRLEMTR